MNFGLLYVSNTTFDSNHAYAHDPHQLNGGGAIYNAGSLNITHTTPSHNTAQLQPVGEAVWRPRHPRRRRRRHLQWRLRTAHRHDRLRQHVDGEGGAIKNSGAGNLTLINGTIPGNHGVYSGGIDTTTGGKLKLGNTIVATNTDVGREFLGACDVVSDLTSYGDNLIGVGYPFQFLPTDQVGTRLQPLDPKLAALAFNGGPTTDHRPVAAPACSTASWTLGRSRA